MARRRPTTPPTDETPGQADLEYHRPPPPPDYRHGAAEPNHPARLEALATMKRIVDGPAYSKAFYAAQRAQLLRERGFCEASIEIDRRRFWGRVGDTH